MTKAKCGCLYEGSVQFCTLHTAAPKLLNAAIAVVDILRRHGFDTQKRPHPIMGVLRAAIAQAEAGL